MPSADNYHLYRRYKQYKRLYKQSLRQGGGGVSVPNKFDPKNIAKSGKKAEDVCSKQTEEIKDDGLYRGCSEIKSNKTDPCWMHSGFIRQEGASSWIRCKRNLYPEGGKCKHGSKKPSFCLESRRLVLQEELNQAGCSDNNITRALQEVARVAKQFGEGINTNLPDEAVLTENIGIQAVRKVAILYRDGEKATDDVILNMLVSPTTSPQVEELG